MPHLEAVFGRWMSRSERQSRAFTTPSKWKRPYYGLPELGWIIELAAYDVPVNVVFLDGADFDSPPPLGTTDRTRYIKVTTLEQAQRPEPHERIVEATDAGLDLRVIAPD